MYAKLFELLLNKSLEGSQYLDMDYHFFISLVGVKPLLMSLKSSLITKNLNLKRTNKLKKIFHLIFTPFLNINCLSKRYNMK